MKLVVLELRDDRAAVLDEEGIVRIIKNRQYQVGQKLDLKLASLVEPHSVKSFLQKRLLPAAAAVAILFTGGSFAAMYIPCSSVTVSGNNTASVKYDLNVFDQILSVSADSEEGESIAAALQRSVKGTSLSAALDTTLDMMEKQGLLEQESETIFVSVKGPAALKKGWNDQVQTRVDSWKKEIREKQQNRPELSPQDNTVDRSKEAAVPVSEKETNPDITPDTDRSSSVQNGVDEKSDAHMRHESDADSDFNTPEHINDTDKSDHSDKNSFVGEPNARASDAEGDKDQMKAGSGVPSDMQNRDIAPEENHPAASDPQEGPPQNIF